MSFESSSATLNNGDDDYYEPEQFFDDEATATMVSFESSSATLNSGDEDYGPEQLFNDETTARIISFESSLATLNGDDDHVPELFADEIGKLPLSLASALRRFLRVANQIDCKEPRVAYLCRFDALERAHKIDRTGKGKGVRLYKASLLKRLEQDDNKTRARRKAMNDEREVRRVFNEYKGYIIRHSVIGDFANRRRLANARSIASVLYEVSEDMRGAQAV